MKLDILARIAAGAPLRHICAEPGMPCEKTVRNWRLTDEGFAEEIGRLKAMREDHRLRGLRRTQIPTRFRLAEEPRVN